MTEKTIRSVAAENPMLLLLLGACPAMGATATVQGALGMGAAALMVMVFSAAVFAALRKAIPACARIPACILILAGFTSIVQMLMNAFLPDVYGMLGIYLTVAAVDLLIFAAGEEGSVASAAKTGVKFLLILLVMGVVREVLGSASIAGAELAFLKNYRIPLLAMAPGGFLIYSFTAAVVSKLAPAAKAEGRGAACAAAGLCGIEREEVEAE